MTNENNFYREIANIPPLPPDLYGSIDRAICRQSRFKKSIFAIAASIVLLIGTSVLITIRTPRTDVVQPEVASELQIIHDYFTGSDLEGDLKLYSVVEGY